MAKGIKQIAKIKNSAARNKADMAYDKAHGIKEGSAKDKKLDAQTKVAEIQYGKKK